MKELSIEEKAKAYDEAIEKARVYHETDTDNTMSVFAKGIMEYLFPELAESGDERIKREIINYFECQSRDEPTRKDIHNKWIAWLKKQGEQKPDTDFSNIGIWKYIVDAVLTEKEGIGQYLDSPFTEEVAKKLQKRFGNIEQKPTWSEDERIRKTISDILLIDSDEIREILDANNILMQDVDAWLEKQDEQKPADKVEPKFHEGEWVTDGTSVFQIVKIESEWYIADDGERVCFDVVHQYYHLWTIQDAKVGDILFQDLMDGMTFIFDGVNLEMAILYSFIINNDGEDVLPYDIGKPNTGIGDIEENKNIIHPATKEQRDLLFSKMKEAGYEWNAEKKELKKIGQKPTENKDYSAPFNIEIPFGAKDSELIQETIRIPDGCYAFIEGNEIVIKKGEKPAWSEEDEKFINDIEESLLAYKIIVMDNDIELANYIEKEINWLKFLKDRVGFEVNCTTTKE